MRPRLLLAVVTASLVATAAAPAPGAQAADALPLPCVDVVGVVQVACDADPAPAPSDAERLCPGADLPATSVNADAMRAAATCLVNHERTARGLKPLKPNAVLSTVATGYARQMVAQDFFDHVSPSGSTLTSRIRRTSYLARGVRAWSLGENIAWGTSGLGTAGSIVDAWMHSAGHRKNILTPGFTEMGMGVAIGAPEPGESDDDAATYVNEFGSRKR